MMKKQVAGLLAGVMFLSMLVFAPKSASAKAFHDVPYGFWANKEIMYLSDLDIMNGYNDGNFGVDDGMTRGQVAAILARTKFKGQQPSKQPHFSDLSTNHLFYREIALAVEQGVFTGYPDGTFQPDKILTRAEMATLLSKAYQLVGQSNQRFSDVSPSHWAFPYIQGLAQHGISAGNTDGTFKPDAKTTRAQFSVFEARVLNEYFRPGQTSSKRPVFQDIALGMTMDEVKAKAKGTFAGNDDTNLIYSVSYKGLPAHVVYEFNHSGELKSIFVFIDGTENYTKQQAEQLFHKLKNELSHEYGSPEDVDLDWNNDGEQDINAYWKSEHHVLLKAFVDEDQEMATGVVFAIE